MKTTALTNAEFMTAIFTDLQDGERPMVVQIDGVINDDTKWPIGTSWTPGTNIVGDRLNNYCTLSTFKPINGKYRRRKAQWFRCYGVMLDDIGTKAAPRERLDGCPPSCLIETSNGNHQALLLFDEPCTDLPRAEALQDRLVEAGLCDPGAKGPANRLSRLPVAINGKYSPPHQVELIEWHPERRYSIDQIDHGLELEPLTPAGSRSKVRTGSAVGHGTDVYQPRPAVNPVIAALRKLGLYKRPLGSGKHDITCPWVQEHTDEVDHGTAIFEPRDLYPLGGFKCQHGHCADRRMHDLLEFLDITFTAAKNKPTIRVAAGELDRVVDASERELAAGSRHYQRGGLIVTVNTDRGTGETSIRPVTANALMRTLSSRATFERYDARAKGYVATDPPTKHVNVLIESESYQHLLVLRAIARQPYLRDDDTLMTDAGFDPKSGMFGAFDDLAFDVPAEPDKATAAAALAELKALLAEVAFAKDHDASAALAMMLTAAIRPALPAAPMGLVKASTISSGKSYLVSLFAGFAGPDRPSAYAFPTTEEECSKLLLAALLEGPAVVSFDNLTSDVNAYKSLCSALTEEHITDRLLGFSKTVTVPTSTLFLASGNNVDPMRDMVRRVLTITLDPKCETPATRRFIGDPVATVRRRREHFVSLALTIVRAYIAAGCPDQGLTPLNSFGAWSRLARAPLVWLGLPDPAFAVFERMKADPDRETLNRMLIAWRHAFGTSPTSVRDAMKHIEWFGGSNVAELTEIMRDVAELRGEINRNRLGRWIARHQGRIVNGLRFERDAPSGGSERWSVKGVSVVSGAVSDRPGESVTTDPLDDEDEL